VKLVTYDAGKVGYVDGEEIVRLDVPSMREWFERGGADETGERAPLGQAGATRKTLRRLATLGNQQDAMRGVDGAFARRARRSIRPHA